MIIIKKTKGLFYFVVSIYLLLAFCVTVVNAQNQFKPNSQKQIIIEDFDSGSVNLTSYPIEDEDPLDWELNSSITYENSPFSLRLSGNTWKVQSITPTIVDTGEVWQVSTYIASQAEIQGIGFMDNTNVLFYSFTGSEEVNIEEWIPVYQGCFPEDQWNDYQLPIADDWMAFHQQSKHLNFHKLLVPKFWEWVWHSW